MVQFFFGINNETVGPLDEEAIRRRVSDGAITMHTLAWKQGQEGWMPVAEIPELMTAFGDVLSATTPPPLPGRAAEPAAPPPLPSAGAASRSGDNTVPAGLSGLQAIAYRFVFVFWKPRRNRTSRVCNYVREDPTRAVPVATATLVGFLLVLSIAVAPFIGDQDYGPQPVQGPGPASQMGPGPNVYQPMIDAQRDMGRMIDEGYRDRSKSFDRQSETYRRGTYDWYGNKD